jgi:hypothetical protein
VDNELVRLQIKAIHVRGHPGKGRAIQRWQASYAAMVSKKTKKYSG